MVVKKSSNNKFELDLDKIADSNPGIQPGRLIKSYASLNYAIGSLAKSQLIEASKTIGLQDGEIKRMLRTISEQMNSISLASSASLEIAKGFRESAQYNALLEASKLVSEYSKRALGTAVLTGSLVSQIQSTLTSVSEWVKSNSYIFDTPNKLWAESLRQLEVSEKEAARILRKYNLFISPNLPITFLGAIIRIDRESKKPVSDIRKLFLEYFREDGWNGLERHINKWDKNALFAGRTKIFRDCLAVIKLADPLKVNYCNVVLPTLVSQIDGIANDYMSIKGVVLANMTYADKKKSFREKAAVDNNRVMDEIAIDFFLNVMLKNTRQGQELQSPLKLNRHKILHGENTKYGRSDYLIRALLTLDFMSCI